MVLRKEEEAEEGTQMQFKTLQLSSKSPPLNSKRLLFDRRYGWVFDEWKASSEEAFAGGRGMFCIVPLAKGFIEMTSHSIDMVANSAIKILESQDDLSPQHLRANIGNQLRQLATSIRKPDFSLLMFKGKPLFPSKDSSLHQHVESGNLQEYKNL